MFEAVARNTISRYQKMHVQGGQPLKPLIKAVSRLQIPPVMRVMIYKLINNALYIGVTAHDYQIHKKGVQLNSDILVSGTTEFRYFSIAYMHI